MPASPSLRPYYAHLKPVWPRFVAGLLFGVLYSVASGFGLPLMADTVFPILFGEPEEAPQWLVEWAVAWFGEDPTSGLLIVSCLTLPIMMGIRAVSAVGNGYFMTYAGVHVVQSIQIAVFKKFQEMPVRFFQGRTTGELMACLMGYPNQIKQGVVDVSNDLIKQPLTLIAACSFLVYKSFESSSFFAALIGLMSVPPLVFIIRRIGKYLAKRSRQLVKLGEEINSSAIESIQAFLVIRAFNLESKMTHRFVEKLREIFVVTMKSVRGNLMISPSVEFISALGLSAALYLGVRNGMGQGEFLALAVALYMAYSPIKKLGSIHGILKSMEGGIERLDQVLNASSSVPVVSAPAELPRSVTGRIRFQDVGFSYVDGQAALSDVTLEIEPGQTVALVGPSGAGKSTFVNLIPRFMDPSTGSITLDGIDLRKLRPKDLRQVIAYVPQESLLFNAPIKENLRVGRQDAPDEAVMEAARQANAHEYIERMEQGYDTVLSERGASLSGGQRQRISIARAFLRDAPVLLLDEATASLDSDSEFQIQEEMVNLAKGRTTLIIAHRFSTIRIADRILVFDQGRIVGDGTFEELSGSHDLFRSLLDKQQG